MKHEMQQHILDVMKPQVWYTGVELRNRMIERLIIQKNWGAVSYLLSFFSLKKAIWWRRRTTRFVALYVHLSDLEAKNAILGRDTENLTHGLQRREYTITQVGLRTRVQKPHASNYRQLQTVT